MSKSIPEPIKTAMAVLKTLPIEQQSELKKVLPAVAMSLEKSGKTVNEDILHEHIAKGTEHLKSLSKKQKNHHLSNIKILFLNLKLM